MLNHIQKNLKAPKGQLNAFGKYKYRSCEDILEAVKPLLGESVLTLSDDIVEIGGNIYVKSTATLTCPIDNETGVAGEKYQVTAFAREPIDKKGMDASQITGAASSYARKYALNGLFCIDDTKDADTMDNSQEKTLIKSNEDDPGAFVLKFGKFKGEALNSIDNDALKNWAQWMVKNGKVDGPAKEALSAVKLYLSDKIG